MVNFFMELHCNWTQLPNSKVRNLEALLVFCKNKTRIVTLLVVFQGSVVDEALNFLVFAQ